MSTWSIFTEQRKNLKDFYFENDFMQYSEKDILEITGFMKTDAALNSDVIEDVCKELGSDSVPNSHVSI